MVARFNNLPPGRSLICSDPPLRSVFVIGGISVDVLNRSNLAAGKFKVEASAASSHKPVGILQIGDGNFLRAFVDWMVDVTNGAGLFNGQVTIAQPLARGIADLLNAQDGLYTVLLRGVQQIGRASCRERV